MRRFLLRLRICVALASFLLLAAPVDAAVAAPGDPPSSQQGGQGEERRGDPADRPPRKRPQPPRSSGTPARAAATVTCGQTITKDTTLTADVGPCQGDGIIIGADNVRLNLNGRRVLGNSDQGASGEFAGIRLAGRTGVTVTGHPGKSGKTGTVSGFEAGVVIDGGSANTVENLTARDNIGRDDPFNADLGDGIIIFDSPSNRILNNVVVHNGIFDGIGVLGSASDNTIIQGNTVEDTVGAGGGGGSGQGIIVNGADGQTRGLITGTKTEGNTVRRSASGGISNVNNADATVVGNIVEDNGFSNNGGNGIGVRAGFGFRGAATRVLVQDNQVRRNAQNGIVVVRRTFENRIINNVSTDNNKLGSTGTFGYFDLKDENAGCDSNVWSGNVWGSGLYTPVCVTNGGSGPPAPTGTEGPFGDPSCFDGFDNDEDGVIDFGDDPSCKRPPNRPEGPEGDPTCSDGINNDYHRDDLVDGDDPDCNPPTPEGDQFGNCNDGNDNDKDGLIDQADVENCEDTSVGGGSPVEPGPGEPGPGEPVNP